MATTYRGWLHKAHKGVLACKEKRWFVSDGFAVCYSKTEATSRIGKFDLRSVSELDEPEPGHLVITVRGKGRPLHVFLNHLERPGAADTWRALWASAVPASAVRPPLQPHRNAELVDRFEEARRLQKPASTGTPGSSSASLVRQAAGRTAGVGYIALCSLNGSCQRGVCRYALCASHCATSGPWGGRYCASLRD